MNAAKGLAVIFLFSIGAIAQSGNLSGSRPEVRSFLLQKQILHPNVHGTVSCALAQIGRIQLELLPEPSFVYGIEKAVEKYLSSGGIPLPEDIKVQTDESGRFDFGKVIPGLYRLQVQHACDKSRHSRTDSILVRVGDTSLCPYEDATLPRRHALAVESLPLKCPHEGDILVRLRGSNLPLLVRSREQ